MASELGETGVSGGREGEAADGVPLTEEKPDEEEEDGDRHNFASAKDGAKIVAANKDAKKPSAVLDSDSDTYLRNECRMDKWLAIELSQVGCQPRLSWQVMLLRLTARTSHLFLSTPVGHQASNTAQFYGSPAASSLPPCIACWSWRVLGWDSPW